MYVVLIIGVEIAVALTFGRVYALLPNENIVLFSRVFGMFTCIVYIIMMLRCVSYDKAYRPLYSANNHLLDTKLLMRNEEGKLGYYTSDGVWVELYRVKMKQQDKIMVKIKCFYQASKNGSRFSRYNYVAREDEVYPFIMELLPSGQKGSVRTWGYLWRVVLMLVIYAVLFAACLFLYGARDKNTFYKGNADGGAKEINQCYMIRISGNPFSIF